jgi:hypothetical protein
LWAAVEGFWAIEGSWARVSVTAATPAADAAMAASALRRETMGKDWLGSDFTKTSGFERFELKPWEH